MGKLHSLSIDQEEENFLNGVKEDILRVAKVVGGACTEEEIDKTIEELRDQLMDYVGMAARNMVERTGTATECESWDYR